MFGLIKNKIVHIPFAFQPLTAVFIQHAAGLHIRTFAAGNCLEKALFQNKFSSALISSYSICCAKAHDTSSKQFLSFSFKNARGFVFGGGQDCLPACGCTDAEAPAARAQSGKSAPQNLCPRRFVKVGCGSLP